ncbi:MAG TPA: LTA synthase family protein [Bacteroidia bacterium]|nr:LTA synthase family protein [Bacteroidia bacterium]
MIKFLRFPEKLNTDVDTKKKIQSIFYTIIFVLPIIIIGSRGGLQYRPIDMISATAYAEGKNVSLVLNTPFCIIKSANKAQLEKRNYFNSSAIKKYYKTTHLKTDTLAFVQKNVVIIILESIGSEYTALANDKASLTPFLDSLSKKSTNFIHAYANGKTSIKGIPAVIAGIPTLFDGSFTYSAYNANNFESIASLLKKKGYSSSFFHGGNNGTMGFDVFSKAAGFDKYYGRNEYPNQKDYDGHWGIFDEPFYQFFKSRLDQQKQPFVSSFFSLSSHHPYTVPERYKNKFKGNSLEISASVQYADYALQEFFEEAKHTNWYKNSLFVITADHTSMSNNSKYQTDVGIYSIPLLFFDPSDNQGKEEIGTIQQIDIMPSILGKLHYNLPYFAYGNDYTENKLHYAVSFNGQCYQLITDQYCLQFDGEKSLAIYDIKNDQFLKNNLIKSINLKLEEDLLKSIIQTYNQSLIENKMTLKK